jgi:alkylation response protein AidB-like acyl-CoA dehydrogenase
VRQESELRIKKLNSENQVHNKSRLDKTMHVSEKMVQFASEHIAGRDLAAGPFPHDVWEMMRSEGLLEPLTSYSEISSAGKALLRHGGNIGIALSWMLHQLAYRFVFERLGTPGQKEMLSGGKTACLAMSEPKTGAHPKYMKTRAEATDGGYVITGEKAFITNAPIADIFVVIAVTDEKEGRKKFSAIIVPKSSKGLSVVDMGIPFLRPSPHGIVKLDSCTVPNENLIGAEGSAYNEIVLPFREVEDVMMMGPLAGAMEFIISGIAAMLRASPTNDDILLMLGRMMAICETVVFIAEKAAGLLDENRAGNLLPVILVSRTMAAEFQEISDKIISGSTEGDKRLAVMLNDFSKLIRIADGVSMIKQKRLGEMLLK